jgi:hypothetical protein
MEKFSAARVFLLTPEAADYLRVGLHFLEVTRYRDISTRPPCSKLERAGIIGRGCDG